MSRICFKDCVEEKESIDETKLAVDNYWCWMTDRWKGVHYTLLVLNRQKQLIYLNTNPLMFNTHTPLKRLSLCPWWWKTRPFLKNTRSHFVIYQATYNFQKMTVTPSNICIYCSLCLKHFCLLPNCFINFYSILDRQNLFRKLYLNPAPKSMGQSKDISFLCSYNTLCIFIL